MVPVLLGAFDFALFVVVARRTPLMLLNDEGAILHKTTKRNSYAVSLRLGAVGVVVVLTLKPLLWMYWKYTVVMYPAFSVIFIDSGVDWPCLILLG